MLVARELAHVRAHLGDDDQRGGHVDTVNAGEVYAAHLKQLRAQIKLGCVTSPATLLAFGRRFLADVQGLQLGFDLRVALGQLDTTEVKRIEGLLERKEVLASPVALQTLGDLVLAGQLFNGAPCCAR